MSAFLFRHRPVAADLAAVRALVASTGFFSEEETRIAEELVELGLRQGDRSGYHFVFLEIEGQLAGYSTFGPVPATTSSWDLYWIVVDQSRRGQKLGRAVLAETEAQVLAAGGTRLYADTAGRPQYTPTHRFYERCDYIRAAVLEDYYAPGDARVTYLKVLEALVRLGQPTTGRGF
jgi:GNAT superfamily N-acetyltransferase